MPSSTEQTVQMLLDNANLTVLPEEFESFVRTFPAFRAQADGLYQIPGLDEENVALNFDPTDCD